MLNSSNQAWTMYPGLSHGAYECLHTHGTEEQKKLYLRKLTSGHWTGTMCLTEPQCGTDLGLLRTKAEPQADGSYKLTGNKIFISAGEHDMVENIVHLVLARLPDAPTGSKGISLFVVPKWKVKADGSLGERNAIWCGGLEHKMGIHGNATAQIVLEDAEGTLVGEPNKGLAAMFVMMNAARLGVGMQSLGLTEVAYQNAAAYAKDRLQMRSLSGAKAKDKPADPIIVHPDVSKMLLTARAYAEGGRALAMFTTLLLDKEVASRRRGGAQGLGRPGGAADADRQGLLHRQRLDRDLALPAGLRRPRLHPRMGHGAVRARRPHQHDLRGHEHDPVARPARPQGALRQRRQAEEVRQVGRSEFVEEEGVNEEMQEFVNPLADLGEKVTKLTTEIGIKAFKDPDEVGAAAVDYLRVCGHLVFAYLWARMAKVALEKEGSGDPFYTAKLATARFYFAKLLPETAGLIRTARAGVAPMMALDAALF